MTETEPKILSLAMDLDGALEAAREAVAAGECIVLPTDTVYGIGAAAFDAQAVAKLLAAKQRGREMPPPVLIAESSMLRALVSAVPDAARDLVDRFWPGALTIILHAQRSLPLDLGDAQGTVAIRVPDLGQTRSLLRRTGPLAVSSANVSGRPAATTVDAAYKMLGDSVAVYLDAGSAAGGEASTIVDFTVDDHGHVLRQGAIGVEALREVVPELQAD
ncbi:MAG: L-threonylcarbamoyladenylate synthase [Propionibacteriaceae bacterium]|nr:L-threonylcarbamoyladenylate synthase [Propionibacteriaceae bacterium]